MHMRWLHAGGCKRSFQCCSIPDGLRGQPPLLRHDVALARVLVLQVRLGHQAETLAPLMTVRLLLVSSECSQVGASKADRPCSLGSVTTVQLAAAAARHVATRTCHSKQHSAYSAVRCTVGFTQTRKRTKPARTALQSCLTGQARVLLFAVSARPHMQALRCSAGIQFGASFMVSIWATATHGGTACP